MDELLAGPKAPNNWPIPRLKFDPKIDPNYSYSLATDGMAWQAHANPRKPGLAGFYFVSNGSPSDSAYYNPAGNATDTDKDLTAAPTDHHAKRISNNTQSTVRDPKWLGPPTVLQDALRPPTVSP
jgi:hypothetical protein